MEDAYCEEAAECVCNIGCGVKYGETASELASAVEGSEIVDYEGKESGFRHS